MSTDTIAAEETMFGDVIKLLHGDRPSTRYHTLFDAAIAIRDEWPNLDRLERMKAETMLAWATSGLPGLPSIHDHAVSRTRSPWSLRHDVTVGTDGTPEGLCRAIDEHLTDCRRARAATFDGTAHDRCRALMERMKVAHPRLGLSFGYIGNCGHGYDDRSWMFFAKLATPRCHGACDVSFGSHSTAQLGKLMLKAEAEYEAWCEEQERRLDAHEIRIVGAKG